MDDLLQKLIAMRDDVAPHWDAARRDRAFLAIRRLRQRRRFRRVLAVSALISVACLAGVWFGPADLGVTTQPPTPTEARAGAVPAETQPAYLLGRSGALLPSNTQVRLADGSQVTTGDGARVVVRDNRAKDIRLDLQSGAAYFDVVPDKQRSFMVDVAGLQVMVVGTAFELARTDERVRVTVSHGVVRVGTGDEWQQLSEGQSQWFARRSEPQPRAANVRAANVEEDATDNATRGATSRARREGGYARPVKRAAAKSARPRHPGTSALAAMGDRTERTLAAPAANWRVLSESAEYEQAYAELAKGAEVADEPSELMAAADAARWSRHPEIAARYLRQLLARHRRSPLAALAAFTLGRVLLDELGRPMQAAEVFALVQELAPLDAVAEDALAREVEAWSKAGRSEEAHQKASLFQRRYAQSRRLRLVELHGGLREQ